jgi:hypothetical protein
MGMVDPYKPDTLDLTGLSQKNSRWTHNFAQWVSLALDETAADWAVLHQAGHATSFKRNTNGTYNSRESFLTLSASGSTAVPGYPSLSVPASFTLKDGADTTYTFSTLTWQTGPNTAMPRYLLTQIKDHWGES